MLAHVRHSTNQPHTVHSWHVQPYVVSIGRLCTDGLRVRDGTSDPIRSGWPPSPWSTTRRVHAEHRAVGTAQHSVPIILCRSVLPCPCTYARTHAVVYGNTILPASAFYFLDADADADADGAVESSSTAPDADGRSSGGWGCGLSSEKRLQPGRVVKNQDEDSSVEDQTTRPCERSGCRAGSRATPRAMPMPTSHLWCPDLRTSSLLQRRPGQPQLATHCAVLLPDLHEQAQLV